MTKTDYFDYDQTKWEKISYDDIHEGDELKILTLVHDVYSKRWGIAYRKGLAGWNSPLGVILAHRPEDMKVDTYITLRRKKPFELPTEFGAAISGYPKGSKVLRKFVRKGSTTWVTDISVTITEEFLLKHFGDFELIRSGV